MNNAEYLEWTKKNCIGDEHREWINGIDWRMWEMSDGWIAVFEKEYEEYTPTIQAKDFDHAISYCFKVEPVTVPMQEIATSKVRSSLCE